ncbi:tyrosyl-DNA phosphodiesterase-domain-containing protein [Mycena polygramma]|nr:tyrosyl-DNA phosphodiesterase-domain-containing protein [Mycena polygramma]
MQRYRPDYSIHEGPLDGQEDYELQLALALSLEDQNVEPSASKFGSGGQSTTSKNTKRRLSDASIEEQRWKKKRDLHNEGLAAKVRLFQEDLKKAATRPKLDMKYAGGALRLTRTRGRGRAGTPNTVSLEDLIHPDDLSSAFVFSYCIENDLLFEYFPFKTSANPRPYVQVYVGRDISLDSVGKQFAGFTKKRPTKDADFDRVVGCAQAGYREVYGENFHAFYPKLKNGCAHTKMMVLIYPDFLRLVITSANLMALDVILGDNMWFIQDFPRVAAGAKYAQTDFETHLSRHVEALKCPADFLEMYLTPGVFDFSAVKVHLVTSIPGSRSGMEAVEYGQLRLRHVVRQEILKRYTKTKLPRMFFEVCVGSVGHLENEGVVTNLLESCAGNRQKSIEGQPALKLVFPTSADVEKTDLGKDGASNISSHIKWRNLAEKSAEYLTTIFYHYRSKDPGCLFHMKSILALHADAPERTPLYMYMGSANFSASAWGNVMPELRDKVVADTLQTERLEGIANFECGVVIKGEDIAGMLETGIWEDIVPYVRPTEADRYKEDERPFVAHYAPDAPIDRDGDSDSGGE